MSSFLWLNKMSSKSKKQLKFPDKEKQNKLKEKISSGKTHYAKEFEQHFLKCYPSYLEHFPCIKTLFDAAVKMEHFVMFTVESLFCGHAGCGHAGCGHAGHRLYNNSIC